MYQLFLFPVFSFWPFGWTENSKISMSPCFFVARLQKGPWHTVGRPQCLADET